MVLFILGDRIGDMGESEVKLKRRNRSMPDEPLPAVCTGWDLVSDGLRALKNEAYTQATNSTPGLEKMSSEAPSYFDGLPGAIQAQRGQGLAGHREPARGSLVGT
jgi:hypothetical protein